MFSKCTKYLWWPTTTTMSVCTLKTKLNHRKQLLFQSACLRQQISSSSSLFTLFRNEIFHSVHDAIRKYILKILFLFLLVIFSFFFFPREYNKSSAQTKKNDMKNLSFIFAFIFFLIDVEVP